MASMDDTKNMKRCVLESGHLSTGPGEHYATVSFGPLPNEDAAAAVSKVMHAHVTKAFFAGELQKAVPEIKKVMAEQ